MERIEQFNSQALEAACKILADTNLGLSGSDIGYLIQDCKCSDNDKMEAALQRSCCCTK